VSIGNNCISRTNYSVTVGTGVTPGQVTVSWNRQ
jgi:hypothetical protein